MTHPAPPTARPTDAVDGRVPGTATAPRTPRGLLGALAGAAADAARATAAVATAPARGALAAAAGAVRGRAAHADLDDRDSLLVRDALPVAWIVASLWFRAEVRGLHHVPRDRPVLLVGNHSGGNVTPDSFVFALGFASHFGAERPLHVLVHNLVSAYPGLSVLRRLGALPADPRAAAQALAAGSCVLVYPGGAREAHRPSWASDRVDLGPGTDFVRLALDAGVPIVPVVAIGGQETALFLGHADDLWSAVRGGRGGRARGGAQDDPGAHAGPPLSVALPWGLNVGDLLGHLPLPAKIVVQVLPPIDVRERFGAAPHEGAVRDHVEATMQEMLTELGRRRRLPVVG